MTNYKLEILRQPNGRLMGLIRPVRGRTLGGEHCIGGFRTVSGADADRAGAPQLQAPAPVVPKTLPNPSMTDLKLIALDAEDLNILSAHLQDGVLKVADMAFLPRERRFAAILNRFDWAAALPSGKARGRRQRRRSALRFERVGSAALLGIDIKARDRVLSLLAIDFQSTTFPAGIVTLHFSGGAAIRLEVECIEAELRDLGAVWATRSKPEHSEDDTGSKGGGA